jgi:ribonuclease T2
MTGESGGPLSNPRGARKVRLAQNAAVALLAALAATPASAQDDRAARNTPGSFDFYVLALSWSPGFCALRGSERRSDDQCEPGKKLGFVVHGLWPQYERGFPSECDANSRFVPRAVIDEVADLYPSPGLARHEWKMHGTCSGEAPSAYFRAVRRARERVKVPELFSAGGAEQHLTPLEIERAFALANPGLRPDAIAVVCRRDLLQEVRICLDKDLRNFRSCPGVDRSGCRGGGELTISAAP